MDSHTSEKLKILFIIDKWQAGGRQRVLQHIIDGLDKKQFEPILLILSEPKSSFPLPRARIIALPQMRYRSYLFKIAHILRTEQPEIVNSHLGLVMAPLVSIALLISRVRTAVIYTIQSIFDLTSYKQTPFPKIYKYLIARALRAASYITTASQGMIPPLSTEFGVSPTLMQMLPHPVYEKGHSDNRNFDLTEELKIFSVGRFSYPKDFSTILRAFKKAKGLSSVPLSLSLIGGGPDETVLRAKAQKLGLDKNIFKGALAVDRTVFDSVDIFIFSSRSEGMPVALIEALAAGVPVIATDCDFGPRELIINGTSGLLIPIGNVDAMSDAILRLSNDRKLMQTISEKAPTGVKKFELTVAVEEWQKLFLKQRT